MKVYVDKKEWEKICSFAGRKIEYNPLFKLFNDAEDIADHTKQVRMEVCEDIKQKIEKRNNGTRNANYSTEYKDGYSGCCCDLEDILDQIQGETK